MFFQGQVEGFGHNSCTHPIEIYITSNDPQMFGSWRDSTILNKINMNILHLNISSDKIRFVYCPSIQICKLDIIIYVGKLEFLIRCVVIIRI